jgi:PAS domain S-box-containing protein
VRFETVHRTREGRGIPVEIYARAVEVDGRRMVLAAARDITDRKRAEEALRRERDRAQTYLDIAGVAIVALDREGRVRRINQKGASILGRSEEEIVGLDWFASVVAPEDRQAQARAHEAFMAGVVVPEEHFEYRVLAADGGRRTIVWQGSAVLREDGAITGLLMSGDDVTDLRAAEAQHRALEEQLRHAEKMQSIGYLAGGVAHDFNNQLTPIVGYGEMLRKQTREDETLNRYATHVVRAAQRASDLTRQLLAFSRKGALETRPVDIHRLLDEVLNILSRTVDRRIELNRAFDAKYPVVVADSSQLENALLNLAVNARDAMPEGGELTFATQSRKLEEGDPLLVQGGMAAGRYLEVAVRDTGVGIPLEVQGSIFEPFFTTKEVGKGTGLGLAAVYGIVKNHRGDIQVESTPGEGTTFRLLLPMCPEGTEAGDDEEQESEEIRGKGRVLVVDDEAIVRDLLGDVLTSSGYAPQTVENGPQALALLQESPQAFDLVLLDMVMPKLSGLETLREIRQLNRTVPVVVLSGYSRRSNEALLHELGVAAILQKPVTPASLLQTVRDVLDAD